LKEALFFGHGIQAFWLKWNVTHLGEAVYSGLGGGGFLPSLAESVVAKP
jgi:hypothetical protein